MIAAVQVTPVTAAGERVRHRGPGHIARPGVGHHDRVGDPAPADVAHPSVFVICRSDCGVERVRIRGRVVARRRIGHPGRRGDRRRVGQRTRRPPARSCRPACSVTLRPRSGSPSSDTSRCLSCNCPCRGVAHGRLDSCGRQGVRHRRTADVDGPGVRDRDRVRQPMSPASRRQPVRLRDRQVRLRASSVSVSVAVLLPAVGSVMPAGARDRRRVDQGPRGGRRDGAAVTV